MGRGIPALSDNFSDFPVVNLDGLVNSYDYFHVTNGNRSKCFRGQGELELCQGFGLTHLANALNTKSTRANTLFLGTPFPRKESVEYQFKVWPAPPASPGEFDHAGRLWERMAPHFDYQQGNLGVVLDGRLAQGFHWNCNPNDLLAFSWGNQGAENATAQWHQWPETPAGTHLFCVACLILPHDAMPPLRAATMPPSEYLAMQAEDAPPIIRSNFDVYLNDGRLLYIKEQRQPEDIAPHFFVHLDPVNPADLPEHRRQYSFDNLGFRFAEHGRQFGRACFAVRELPDYAIAEIRTGQYVRVGGGFNRLWEGEYRLDE